MPSASCGTECVVEFLGCYTRRVTLYTYHIPTQVQDCTRACLMHRFKVDAGNLRQMRMHAQHIRMHQHLPNPVHVAPTVRLIVALESQPLSFVLQTIQHVARGELAVKRGRPCGTSCHQSRRFSHSRPRDNVPSQPGSSLGRSLRVWNR